MPKKAGLRPTTTKVWTLPPQQHQLQHGDARSLSRNEIYSPCPRCHVMDSNPMTTIGFVREKFPFYGEDQRDVKIVLYIYIYMQIGEIPFLAMIPTSNQFTIDSGLNMHLNFTT